MQEVLRQSAPPPRSESWLLIFNCQVLGLANSLNLLSDEIHVEHYDPSNFRKNANDILARWESFSRVLIAPQIEALLPDVHRLDAKVWKIPTLSFSGYHPDICYLQQSGKALKGPMGDYHSTIAFAAFRHGLSQSATLGLYNEAIYEQLGYLQCWDGARIQLLKTYERAGLDLGAQFINWSRNGAFMYSINHVHVRCLHDIAKAILKRAGKAPAYEDVIPHDNLLNGPVYPIYPEIGQRLGVAGSYLFKLGGQYRFIRLEDFLEQSFDLYTRNPEVMGLPEHSPRIESAIELIGGMS